MKRFFDSAVVSSVFTGLISFTSLVGSIGASSPHLKDVFATVGLVGGVGVAVSAAVAAAIAHSQLDPFNLS